MKTYLKYIIGILCLLGMVACSDRDTEPALTRVVPGTLDDFPADSYELQNPEDVNPLLFTATWTETLFYLGGSSTPTPIAPVEYTLQVDRVGNNFETPQTLLTTTSLVANVYTKEFNNLLEEGLNGVPGEKMEIELRVLTSYGQNVVREVVSGNKIQLAVTPFKDRDPLQLMYIIGDMNGWNNTDADGMYIMFKNNSDSKNHVYTYTGYMPANCYYKFLPEESLGTYKAYCFREEGKLEYVESDGGSLYNATDGYKTITINLKELTYSVEDYDITGVKVWGSVGLIGEFCGWDNEPLMTRFSADNSHIWKMAVTLPPLTSGATHPVKFRANKSWDSRWAATDPESVPYGKSVFLMGDEYDPNIILREGGDYQVIFNDLTGHYIFQKKKQ